MKYVIFVVYGTEQLSLRPPESFNQVLAERGWIVAWSMLPVLVSTSRNGTSAKFERGQVFCRFHSVLPI